MKKNFILVVIGAVLTSISFGQKTSQINPQMFLKMLQEKTKAPVKDFVEKQFKPSEKDSTKQVPIGETNWTKGYIEAEGVCYLNPQHVKSMGKQYATDLCLSGAEADGRANLLGMIMAVHIIDSVRVVDKMIEKKITIQSLDGFIRARRIGAPVVVDNMVRVKMRCEIEGDRGVATFIEGKGLSTTTSTITPEQQAEKDKLATAALDEFKKQGLLPDSAKALPPLVVEIPKEQAANYTPSILPKIHFKDENGTEQNIDLSKYLNLKNQKALNILNSTKEMVAGNGNLNGVPSIEGFVKDGRVNIDMVKYAGKIKNDEKRKKIQAVFKKLGSSLLNVLPVVAAFI